MSVFSKKKNIEPAVEVQTKIPEFNDPFCRFFDPETQDWYTPIYDEEDGTLLAKSDHHASFRYEHNKQFIWLETAIFEDIIYFTDWGHHIGDQPYIYMGFANDPSHIIALIDMSGNRIKWDKIALNGLDPVKENWTDENGTPLSTLAWQSGVDRYAQEPK